MTARAGPPFGATVSGSRTEFRVWAPYARRVDVLLDHERRTAPLAPEDDGVFFGALDEVPAGTDYHLRLDGLIRPDPRSRHQPHGIHGPSRVVDPTRFAWSDAAWKGVARRDLTFYELHVGTFTAAGTFDAAIERLSHLVALGVTAVELMPIGEFPGARNWGYDGVFPFAPHSAYGGPDALRRLVDACHASGLAVFVDTVLNHLGPEGNVLADFGPYFTQRYRTPWGPAFDFDGPASEHVRRYVVDVAAAWIEEYHVDGLRLDAVHSMHDGSDEHVVRAIGQRVHELGAQLGRRTWVTAESDLNDPKVVRSGESGWGVDTQWSDDFHHALYAVVTGDNPAHLADFGSLAELCKAMTDGFVFDGRYSPRRKRHHGAPTTGVDGDSFVVFAQNHDQVANVSAGMRLSRLVSSDAEKAAAMILCSAPYLVLLFQGQEYGETRPFHYFTSHGDPELAARVDRARRAEYAGLAERRGVVVAGPQDASTFAASKLGWNSDAAAGELLALYRLLLAFRKHVACLGNCRRDLTRAECDPDRRWMRVERADPDGTSAVLAVNVTPAPVAVCLPRDAACYSIHVSSRAEPPSFRASFPPGSWLELRAWEAALLVDAVPSQRVARDPE